MPDISDDFIKEGEELEVLVRGVGGEVLAALRLPRESRALQARQRLEAELGVPAYTQRLVVTGLASSATLDGDVLLADLPQPLDLTLVIMTVNNEMGPSLLASSEMGNPQQAQAAIFSATDPNFQDTQGRTAIWFASARGHLDVIALLLEVNADANKAKNDGITPLHTAAARCRVRVLRLLCAAGVDTDVTAPDGRTPLAMAAAAGHPKSVQVLCDARADVGRAAADGWTPLMRAAASGHAGVAELLCEVGADTDSVQQDGCSALFAACTRGHADVVVALCAARADVDRATRDGATPLFAASVQGYAEIVHHICNAAADVNIKKDGVTPLVMAAASGLLEVARALSAPRASRGSAPQDLAEAARVAAQRGHEEVATTLREVAEEYKRAEPDHVTGHGKQATTRTSQDAPR